MIRIEIDKADLEQAIETHKPGWIADAEIKTQALDDDPTLEVKSIWSPIKDVYTKLQNSKCVFCEKKIENQPIEQDVEHFRPKNNVKRWPVPKWLEVDEGVQVKQPTKGSEPGYRLLAYKFLNYAAACKTCNSTRKRDYFPIAGSSRQTDSKDPSLMSTEKAYLIYPVSDLDDDPEELIEFHGLSPQASKATGFGRKRALVTIELFQLDDEEQRGYLFKRRAELVWILFRCLRQIDTGTAQERTEGKTVAKFLTSPESEHTNCLRCFEKLYQDDYPEAETIARRALNLWTTGSP